MAPETLQTVGDSERGQYSIKTLPNGKAYVSVDVDQSLFDGLSGVENLKMAEKVIRDRFVGKVIGSEETVYVDRRSSKEYAHPAKFLGDEELVAKSRASTELDNLLAVAKNWRNKSDGQDGHTHEKATGGFDYGDVLFRVGNKYFTGLVNVEVTDRGRRLKDITKIRETTVGNYPSSEHSEQVSQGDLSDTTIPQNGDGVNTQYMQNSEKDAPVYQAYGRYRADGVVELSANITTEEALEFVVKHELTHAIEGSEAYGKLQQLVRKSMGEEAYTAAVEQAQQERSDRGDTQGARNPEAEVVAD